MVTIKEVAKLAGVAVSTASNALNGKYGVKEATKRRVLETAKQLNYIPNLIAQGLVTKTTRTITMIVSGPPSFRFFTNPVFIEVIKAVTETLNIGNYRTQLNMISMDHEMEEIPRIARSRSADAIILIGTRRDDHALAKMIESIEIPCLVVIRHAPDESIHAVSADHRQCCYVAIKYLIEMGHRHIGFIGDLPEYSTARIRLDAYRQALSDHGIERDDSLVVYGDYFQESGLTGVRHLIRQAKRMPSAIYAANDIMALGALEGLEQEGIRIPGDISLMGTDNIQNLHLLKVPLTTVSIPFHEIGRLAATKIIDILEGGEKLPRQIVLGSELRIRQSVKKI